MKILVDYPSVGEEAAVVGRSLRRRRSCGSGSRSTDLRRHAAGGPDRLVDREAIGYAVALADATRHPAEHGLAEIAPLIEFGASPRGPIGLVQAARVLALLRGRGHVVSDDIRDLAADVLATASSSPTTR